MARLPDNILARIHDVEAELRTVVDGGPSSLETVPRALLELVCADQAVTCRFCQRGVGVCVHDGFEAGRHRNVLGIYNACLAGVPVPWGTYSATRPPPVQRNRAINLATILCLAGVRTPEDIPIWRFYAKVGLDRADQLRVLICDGPALLALATVFREDRFTDLERRTIQHIVPALRRRLSVERTLATAESTRLLLDAAFASIPAPAFVTDALGHVLEASATGQLWLQAEGSAGREMVGEAARHGRHPLFDVTPVAALGAPRRSLLVRRSAGGAQVKYRAAHAAGRWSLTGRQGEVLALVVEGLPTRTMAAVLGVSERCVEAHLTAIFEKAQVETRAELAAAVWRD
jgi:DNA-binding CsgD family transcriptional regulator